MNYKSLFRVLCEYFGIGDSYTYTLKRDKAAFAAGTMSLEDFEEFTEEDIKDIVQFIEDNWTSQPELKAGYVKPVRCKDCKYHEEISEKAKPFYCEGTCRCSLTESAKWMEDYCSDGEPMEEVI